MRLLTIGLLFLSVFLHAQHPVAFISKQEALLIKSNLSRYPVLDRSFQEIKRSVDPYLSELPDVPVPKDAAGGYTHDRHKENYMIMFHAGLLYQITGDTGYAVIVKKTLLKYADLNPALKKHPQATSSSPGHIFWQALNDANWLVYSGLAYDLIYNSLTASERKKIEDGAFKPEVEFFTNDLESWFNLVHNHGVWACAGVGIVGIATGNEEYIQKALLGTKKDGSGGFLAQMEQLFSPDGYYTEGPYYVRYAILPFYMFANALDHARPQMKIFQRRDQILKKALVSGLQLTNTNGAFFPFNDALKEKDYTSNELVTAIAIARNVYGKDAGLLTVAAKQNRVMLHNGGMLLAAELQNSPAVPAAYPYKSVEYTDGAAGKQGGITLLRSGSDKNLMTLGFKYASHGLSHGHFDQLGIFLYNNGNEVLQDYGSVRFVGVEQKYGGRYLPENKTYAASTIAHNVITVDERSQFDGKEAEAEKHHGEKLFSALENKTAKVVSAKQSGTYPGIDFTRSLYMIAIPGNTSPLIIDLYRTRSEDKHQYDLPFQYAGTVISTSFKYTPSTTTLEILGKQNGYQHLWKEAEAKVNDTTIQFTFLNGRTFYTITSHIDDSATIYLARAGANDPNFNLRREPSYIIRRNGKSECFVNVIEAHGNVDPVAEFSTNAYPSVQNIRLLKNDEEYTVAVFRIKGKDLLVAQSNREFEKNKKHQLNIEGRPTSWTGPYVVLFNGKSL